MPMFIIMKMNAILLVMPNAPTARSPPWKVSALLMKMMTMHEQAFMANGDMPMAMMFLMMCDTGR